jgi:8-oxo-dGTP pyrophosphatase MutT (NUDIX family)
MKKLWEIVGRMAFWFCWPLIYVYSLKRTRASVLVVDGSKVLLVKNWLSSGKWALPGGGVAHNESPLACARRELIEELGLNSKPQELKLILKGWFKESGLKFYQVCFGFDINSKPRLKIRKWELVDARWFSKNELSKVRLSGEAIQALETWL